MRLIFLLSILLNATALLSAPLESARSFGYQLQNFNVAELAASPLDLFVIDYSFDGSAAAKLSSADIDSLHNAGKTVLAYLSIGEAEEYRYYFRPRWIDQIARGVCGRTLTNTAPAWLDDPNPNWCGNYKVRYWEQRWQRIILGKPSSYLDQIVAVGFDGVYLDIVDGFEYWREKTRRRSAAREMAQFVISISRHARKSQADFIVVPQNGSAIISKLPASLRQDYLDAIDGIGAEDTFFFGDNDEDNPLTPQTDVIANLDQFRAAGKVVLATDYLTNTNFISQFQSLACAHSYLPQVNLRQLERLDAQTLLGCS